jgi:ElaB/YqjD/DUF883 family membrane-anchored ribosome-binding protein
MAMETTGDTFERAGMDRTVGDSCGCSTEGVASKMHNVSEGVKSGMKHVGASLRSASASAVRRLEEGGSTAIDTISRSARDATQKLDSQIIKAPMISLASAFGIGVLLGAMCGGFKKADY